jgi:hypothetical protein
LVCSSPFFSKDVWAARCFVQSCPISMANRSSSGEGAMEESTSAGVASSVVGGVTRPGAWECSGCGQGVHRRLRGCCRLLRGLCRWCRRNRAWGRVRCSWRRRCSLDGVRWDGERCGGGLGRRDLRRDGGGQHDWCGQCWWCGLSFHAYTSEK